MVRRKRNLSGVPGLPVPRRAGRIVAIGLAIATALAAAQFGIGVGGGPADAAEAAVASGTSTVTVTKVAATRIDSSAGKTVRTTLEVKNTASVRKPATHVWLYLTSGSRKYTLGQVSVKALAAGASTTVRAEHQAPTRVPAGKYAVMGCAGAYAAQKCRTSASAVTVETATPAPAETGVMLDIARAYYPVALIKGYIDLVSDNGGQFLHLHLTDDQNVGVESNTLGQTLANAVLRDGVYTSRVTGRAFLSVAQAQDITAYAAKRGIVVVPEVDTPGHMAAAFALLEAQHGQKWVDRIRAGESELNTSAPESSAFAARLYAEVAKTFPTSRAVHIGGDEWGGDVTADERVAWLNAMAANLGDRDVWAWNDGIDRSAVRRLDPRIHITYWSFDGDAEDKAERLERRERRAKASDLYAAGIDLLNYNSYYLYEVPTDLDPADSTYAAADLRENWSLRSWDGDSGALLAGPMSGAAVAIWGEDLIKSPSKNLLRWSTPHIVAMIETATS